MVASTYFNFQWCFQAERFLEPINDKINLYNNHKTIFNILSNINTSVSTKNASKDVLEKGAKECIKLGESFPVLFPSESITRKQHVVTFVLPKFLRSGTCYKFLKIEQMCEYLHCLYNGYESSRKNIKYRGRRFFRCIRLNENAMKTGRHKLEKRLKVYPKGKNHQ